MKIKKGVEVGGGDYVINDQKFVGNLGQKGKITCACFSQYNIGTFSTELLLWQSRIEKSNLKILTLIFKHILHSYKKVKYISSRYIPIMIFSFHL